MNRKSERIASIIKSLPEGQWDPHYRGFFECFNRQLFFEAHEVLEELWLARRGTEQDLFYKGLIQLAGAFVHLQKRRCGPALALFRLASRNLGKYPAHYESLDLAALQARIAQWAGTLEREPQSVDGWGSAAWPGLTLDPGQAE